MANKKSAFDEAKPRTPKAAVKARENEMTRSMQALLNYKDEDAFREAMDKTFKLKPGEPRYEAALEIWKSGQ